MRWINRGLALLMAATLLTAGCDKSQVAVEKPAAPATPMTVPDGFVLKDRPADVKDLTAVKTGGVKDGDEVVVRAVAGGAEKPFVANRAVVQVIDPSVQTCDKMGMSQEACHTPWDACCHQDDARKNGATVQVVDAKGEIAKGSLEGVAGLKPGKEFIVKGKAKWEGDGKNLVIDATNVFVQ